MKSPILHPDRRFNTISANTENLLRGLQASKKEASLVSPPIRENDTILLKKAMASGNFTNEGHGIFKEAYKNQDYGRIWVKKTIVNEKTGQKEDWLVKYVDDTDELIRQVASSTLNAMRKVAATKLAPGDRVETLNGIPGVVVKEIESDDNYNCHYLVQLEGEDSSEKFRDEELVKTSAASKVARIEFPVGDTVDYHGRTGKVTYVDKDGRTVLFEDTGEEEYILLDELKEQNEGFYSEAAASVAAPEWIKSHLPKGWQKMSVEDVAMHLVDQADSLEGNDKADVSLDAMKRAFKLFKNEKTAAPVDPKNIPLAQGIKSKNITMDETGGGGTAKVTVEFTDVSKGLDFYQNQVAGGGEKKAEPKDDTDQLADEVASDNQPPKEPAPKGQPQIPQPPAQAPPMTQASSLKTSAEEGGYSAPEHKKSKPEYKCRECGATGRYPSNETSKGRCPKCGSDKVLSVKASLKTSAECAQDTFGQMLCEGDQVKLEDGRRAKITEIRDSVVYVIPTMGAEEVGTPFPVEGSSLTKWAAVKKADHLEDTPVSVDIHIEGEPEILDELLEDILGDQLEGGKGDEVDVEDLDQDELEKGKEHEKEHTNDDDIAEEIAADHLSERAKKGEDQDYYEDLDEMEKKNKKESSLNKKAYDFFNKDPEKGPVSRNNPYERHGEMNALDALNPEEKADYYKDKSTVIDDTELHGFNTGDTSEVGIGENDPGYQIYKKDCELRGENCLSYDEWVERGKIAKLEVRGFDESDPYEEDGASTDATDSALQCKMEKGSPEWMKNAMKVAASHGYTETEDALNHIATKTKTPYHVVAGWYIQLMKNQNQGYSGSKAFGNKIAADVSDEVPPASWTEKESQSWDPKAEGVDAGQAQPLPPNPNLNQNPGDVLYNSNNAQQGGPAKFQVTTDPVNKSVEVKWVDDAENLQNAVQPQGQQPPQYQIPQSQPQQQKSPLVRDIPNVPQQQFQDQQSEVQY